MSAASASAPVPSSTQAEAIMSARALTKRFPIRRGLLNRVQGQVHAVTDVDFDLRRGETLGLVGESGCGKSTTGRLLLRLLDITSGDVVFDGLAYSQMDRHDVKALRRRLQMVFQDPYGSLSPRFTTGDLMTEPMLVNGIGTSSTRRRRVEELMERVGLSARHLDRYPAQFSGGQRQRLNIARALTLEPDVLVLDEPVSALDVSVQAQVVNLLADLQADLGLAYVFIAHDLSIVRHISHRVAVMYLGRIVETGTRQQIFERPSHPYTRALLASVPVPDPARRSLASRPPLTGDVPSPAAPPSGCVFRTRCPLARERCAEEIPVLRVGPGGSQVSCHFAEEAFAAQAPSPGQRPA